MSLNFWRTRQYGNSIYNLLIILLQFNHLCNIFLVRVRCPLLFHIYWNLLSGWISYGLGLCRILWMCKIGLPRGICYRELWIVISLIRKMAMVFSMASPVFFVAIGISISIIEASMLRKLRHPFIIASFAMYAVNYYIIYFAYINYIFNRINSINEKTILSS